MKPEDFIREKLRKDYGDDVAKEFDNALAKGLLCELCGKQGTDVAIRRFEQPPSPTLTGAPPAPRRYAGDPIFYEAVRAALPKDEKSGSTLYVSSVPPALCDACYGMIEGKGANA